MINNNPNLTSRDKYLLALSSRETDKKSNEENKSNNVEHSPQRIQDIFFEKKKYDNYINGYIRKFNNNFKNKIIINNYFNFSNYSSINFKPSSSLIDIKIKVQQARDKQDNLQRKYNAIRNEYSLILENCNFLITIINNKNKIIRMKSIPLDMNIKNLKKANKIYEILISLYKIRSPTEIFDLNIQNYAALSINLDLIDVTKFRRNKIKNINNNIELITNVPELENCLDLLENNCYLIQKDINEVNKSKNELNQTYKDLNELIEKTNSLFHNIVNEIDLYKTYSDVALNRFWNFILILSGKYKNQFDVLFNNLIFQDNLMLSYSSIENILEEPKEQYYKNTSLFLDQEVENHDFTITFLKSSNSVSSEISKKNIDNTDDIL